MRATGRYRAFSGRYEEVKNTLRTPALISGVPFISTFGVWTFRLLFHDHAREWEEVGREEYEQADQDGEGEAVKEDVAQNAPFLAVPARRGAGDDDALGVDHLAHHAAGAVGGGHQHRTQAELEGG